MVVDEAMLCFFLGDWEMDIWVVLWERMGMVFALSLSRVVLVDGLAKIVSGGRVGKGGSRSTSCVVVYCWDDYWAFSY